MALTTYTDDTALTAASLNGNFNASGKILIIDTTTDLNVSATKNSSGIVTDVKTKSYSFTTSQLSVADYVYFDFNGLFARAVQGSATAAHTDTFLNVKIETTAPSSATILNTNVVEYFAAGGTTSSTYHSFGVQNLRFIHTLTSGEKNSGVTFLITITASANGGSSTTGNSLYTNRQIIIYNGV